MSDPLKIKQYIRTVNDFPIDGIAFRDITSLIETLLLLLKPVKSLQEFLNHLMQLQLQA